MVVVPEVLICILFQDLIWTEYLFIMSLDATVAWSQLLSCICSYYILHLQESVRSSAHGMTSPALESLVVTVESSQSTFSASPSPPRSYNTLPLQITGRSPTAGIDTLDSLRFYYKVKHSGIVFGFQGIFVDIQAWWSRSVLKSTFFGLSLHFLERLAVTVSITASLISFYWTGCVATGTNHRQ